MKSELLFETLFAVCVILGGALSGDLALGGGAVTRYVATGGVDQGNDCVDAGSPCATVAHAIAEASSGDRVQIAAGVYTEHGVFVDKSLTIVGAGQGQTIIQAAASPESAPGRVFSIGQFPSGEVVEQVALRALTIRHGRDDFGGGVRLNTKLRVAIFSRVTIADNVATGAAGGILVGSELGPVLFDNCVIRDNVAAGLGGAMALGAASSNDRLTTIRNSEVRDNVGTVGIFVDDLARGLFVVRSSITGNAGHGIATAAGGARVDVVNSTINRNEVGIGSNLLSTVTLLNTTSSENDLGLEAFGSLVLGNSIVAGNTGDDCQVDFQSTSVFSRIGPSLFAEGTGCAELLGPGDRVVEPASVFETVLGPFGDHGGATPTYPLGPDSLATDAGDRKCLDLEGNMVREDQRGSRRSIDGDGDTDVRCDLGSFEYSGND